VRKLIEASRTSDEGQSFNALKVSVFNRHDAGVSKQLFWVIVDELSATTSSMSTYNNNCQQVLANIPVNNRQILLEQRFPAHTPLVMAINAFRLDR